MHLPHAPTADPFADTWYAYVHDPAFGYLKVAWLSYLNEHSEGGRQHGYVHAAHAPVGGGRKEADHWSRSVTTEAQPERGPDAFRFDIPGAAAIDERRIAVTLPEMAVTIDRVGDLLPYFPEPDAAASPFVGPGSRPGGTSHWFVQTLGTPADWRYEDDDDRREGRGLLYAERGWSVRQADGFCYLMAVSPEAKVVVTGGMAGDAEPVWAGRVVTTEHDLTFLPFAGDTLATSDLHPHAARAEISFGRGDLEVRVRTQAPLGDFYDQITPSMTVFHAEHPVAKTMQAELGLEVLVGGEVVEAVALPQSIFELGGALYPVGGIADRPTVTKPGEG